MLILKRVPWVALLLVLLSYSTLGWVISEAHPPRFVWPVVVFAILLLISSLTIPWSQMAELSLFFFKSNTRTFVFALSLALLFFLMLAWFRVFLDTLLIISAAILAKIDSQASGLKPGQAFWLTSVFSLAGLALGVALQMVFRS
ncbi:hypothetical protein [Fortiea contorta]|uniref:hypothetical protein n=1 Tax=Fortiea contorta TaxID=1892405 RepID=UPI0003793CFC|nr:hypothetical protein [Fortiea contorta]